MSLDDHLWEILDKLHLGEFFDQHNIPPIVFPIAIIAVIAVVLLLMTSGGGGGEEVELCGDTICDPIIGEDEVSCPEDCIKEEPPPEKTTIKVYITGALNCKQFSISLKNSDGNTISTRQTSTTALTFQDIVDERVYLEVSSTDSDKAAQKSTTINTKSQDTIRLSMPDDYCEKIIETGSIQVTVKDKQTGASMAADITLFDRDGVRKSTKYINGQGTFLDLEPGWYYLTASSTGYEDYFGGDTDLVIVEKNQQKTQTVSLQPKAVVDATGKLEVCVSGEDAPCPAEGEISVFNMEDDVVKVGSLAGCPLTHGGSVSSRCFTFDLPAGEQFYVAVTRSPGGCSVSEKEGPFTISETDKKTVTIRLNCNIIGGIRAIVYANDTVVTDNCTVVLYYENGSLIKTLNMSPDGEHTETVNLPGGSEVYVYAKNVPDGFLPRKSEDVEIEANETQTVEIDLRPPPPPLPNLTIQGAEASPLILKENDTITITVSKVKLEGVTMTPDDGVSVVCESSWREKSTANYTGSKWICNLTATGSLGQKTITVTANKNKANSATESFTAYVVNDSVVNYLKITNDLENFVTMQSPVTLYFIINVTDETMTPIAPLAKVLESQLIVKYRADDNSEREVANTTISRVRDGYYKANFPVPFAGEYVYKLTVKAVLNDTLHMQSTEYGFEVLQGTPGALTSCEVEPRIIGPNQVFSVTAEFELDGDPVPDQRLQVHVEGRDGEEAVTTLVWKPETGTYEADVLSWPSECVQKVTCASTDDSDVSNENSIYVVDPNAEGASSQYCPVNAYDCGSLDNARDCYALYMSSQTNQYYDHAISCAQKALEDCSFYEPSEDCYQGVRLRIVAHGGGLWNATDDLSFWIDSPTQGEEILVRGESDDLPTLDVDTVSYKIAKVALTGDKVLEYDCDTGVTECSSSFITVKINSSSGELTAETFCPLNCGTRGDLNDDGDVDETDELIMASIIDAVQLFGAPPYYPWPPACLDVNQDGYFTYEDYGCLDSRLQDCDPCTISSGMEICHDGLDNDCDGQIDYETYDNVEEEFYKYGNDNVLTNLCGCSVETPCDMVYDKDGTPGYSSESGIKRCVSVADSSYNWVNDGVWQCNEANDKKTLRCDSKAYYCSHVDDDWVWFNRSNTSDTYPPNSAGGGSGSNTYYKCNHNTKVCELAGGTQADECGDYWTDCAYGTCDYATGTCAITTVPDVSGTLHECTSSSDCAGLTKLSSFYWQQPDINTWHVMTTDDNVADYLRNNGYFEAGDIAKAFDRQVPDSVPLYRLWHPSGVVYYVTNQEEVNAMAQYGYQTTGDIDGYVYPMQKSGTIPLYELYCEGPRFDYFYYTASADLPCWTSADGQIVKVYRYNNRILGYAYPL